MAGSPHEGRGCAAAGLPCDPPPHHPPARLSYLMPPEGRGDADVRVPACLHGRWDLLASWLQGAAALPGLGYESDTCSMVEGCVEEDEPLGGSPAASERGC